MNDRPAQALYRDYRFSRGGIAASILGCFSMGILIALTAMSAMSEQQLAPWAGALGIAAFCVALMGVSLGLGSFGEKCRSYLFSKIGTIYCGFMVACWFLIFCVGLNS